MTREGVEQEDEFALEAKQTKLILFPYLGAGIMLHLLAESEHLSVTSLPQKRLHLLLTDKLFSHMKSGQTEDLDIVWSCLETVHVSFVLTYWKYVWFR